MNNLTLKNYLDLVEKKEISPKEYLLSRIEKIKKENQNINAVIDIDEEDSLKTLENNKEIENTALKGATLLIKDNMNLKGRLLNCSSQLLEGYKAPYTATSCQNLLNAGGVLLGRCNMDEFAMGSSTETSFFGITRNPINLEYVPGGSSGGSAASVAADYCLASLGSDTGGSIRQPANCCGIVGLKPTYGLVSRYGLIAFSSSLDQIGPLTKTVEDSAILMNHLAGHDPLDSTSQKVAKVDYTDGINDSLKGKKIAFPVEYFDNDGLDQEIKVSLEKVKDFFEKQGCEIVEVSLKNTFEYSMACYYITNTAEASSNLARFDGVRYGRRVEDCSSLEDVYLKSRSEGFGAEVKRRILLGTHVLSSGFYEAYYGKAQKVRELIKEEFENIFKTCDVVFSPMSAEKIFKLGEKFNEPIKMYLSDLYTTSANLSGHPAISIPCGKDSNGLPISFQLIGKNFCEKDLFHFGNIFENNFRLVAK